jgi:dTDP-4-dehydrorhamnose 3,5-epimerase
MKIVPTAIEGVVVVETAKHADQRGEFYRAFCRNELAAIIGERSIAQANVSRTLAVGAVRGLHFQRPPEAEMKLIRCIKGKVWDVAVDLRAGSPTYLHWHGQELDAAAAKMLVIPEGCAHGFQVLEEGSELLYLHTAFYSPAAEGGVAHNDPRLAISWPLAVSEVSERDRLHPIIDQNYQGILL